jgi:hypothetical protein
LLFRFRKLGIENYPGNAYVIADCSADVYLAANRRQRNAALARLYERLYVSYKRAGLLRPCANLGQVRDKRAEKLSGVQRFYLKFGGNDASAVVDA